MEYLTDLFRVYLNMCERQKIDSLKLTILETSGQICNKIISSNPFDLEIILNFWKETADNAIGKSRETFSKIIQLYRSLTDYAFTKGIVDNNTLLDNIFRHLGWLGERLINRHGIEVKPLMHDRQYYNEYDYLFELLLTCSHEYKDKYPTSYPLLYFDFVDVIFLQIVSYNKEVNRQRLKENIFDCLYVLFIICRSCHHKR